MTNPNPNPVGTETMPCALTPLQYDKRTEPSNTMKLIIKKRTKLDGTCVLGGCGGTHHTNTHAGARTTCRVVYGGTNEKNK